MRRQLILKEQRSEIEFNISFVKLSPIFRAQISTRRNVWISRKRDHIRLPVYEIKTLLV
jgi:hypothetical protein